MGVTAEGVDQRDQVWKAAIALVGSTERRIAMMKKLMLAVAMLALGASATVVLAQRQGTNTVSAQGRYLPEYTKEGDLILPKNWRSWVYVGSPLTPDALNNGKANFPEYHNVYIE